MVVTTSVANFTIRTATVTDTPLILSFIKELAEYEKLSNEVVATEEILAESLFGEHSSFAEVVIGYYKNEPVAFALFFHNFSTFLGKPGLYLEDLYVNPEMRGKGIGKVLILYLANLAKKRGCGRFEWWSGFYSSCYVISFSVWAKKRVWCSYALWFKRRSTF